MPYQSRVTKDWRAARNLRALDRLMQGRHERFPESVWRHAVARPLVPPTLTRAVESYWRHHPLRADRLARALAARSGAPEGWSWHVGELSLEGSSATFRSPPTPYRCTAFARGPGHCCICGQPVYRFGWHADENRAESHPLNRGDRTTTSPTRVDSTSCHLGLPLLLSQAERGRDSELAHLGCSREPHAQSNPFRRAGRSFANNNKA